MEIFFLSSSSSLLEVYKQFEMKVNDKINCVFLTQVNVWRRKAKKLSFSGGWKGRTSSIIELMSVREGNKRVKY